MAGPFGQFLPEGTLGIGDFRRHRDAEHHMEIPLLFARAG
jgi:hypothetical protein